MKKTALALLFVMLFNPSTALYAETLVVEEGTEILLKVIDKLKSGEVKKGQVIQFLVEKAVTNEEGFILIPEKADAYGTVIKSKKAGMMGASGSLEIAIDTVEAFNGKSIRLRGSKDDTGTSSTGAVVAGFLFVSMLSVFFRGDNAVVPAGTILRAYADETVVLSGDVVPESDGGSYFQGDQETDQKLNELIKKMEEKK